MTRRHGTRLRFTGAIAGLGLAEGTRLVVGRWTDSPFGPFADVMVERANGHRVLLAPSRDVADFVAVTYTFDEVLLGRVDAAVVGDTTPAGDGGGPRQTWTVRAGPLDLVFTTGRRTVLGRVLRLVPTPLATRELTASITDPLARMALRGVRTAGSAGQGRHEWYLAGDHHAIHTARARWDGRDLGDLRPVHPPVRFGFTTTPKRPSVTRVVTIVRLP